MFANRLYNNLFKRNSTIHIFVIWFFVFEIISYGFYKLNLLEISHKPKIYLSKGEVPNDEWWTEESIWGAWHIKNSKTRQKRSCYDATYISNEVGARDSSFSLIENSLLNLLKK